MNALTRVATLPLLLFTGILAAQSKPALQPDYGKLPLSFEANQGQTDPQVRFTSRGNGYGLYLTDSAAVLTLSKHPAKNDPLSPKNRLHDESATSAAKENAETAKSDVIRMELAGANPPTPG
jgi:hypothetical protein